jgi:hypothetical protein
VDTQVRIKRIDAEKLVGYVYIVRVDIHVQVQNPFARVENPPSQPSS